MDKQTLARWRCQDKGPPYVKVGRQVAYQPADVFAWIQSRREEPGVRV